MVGLAPSAGCKPAAFNHSANPLQRKHRQQFQFGNWGLLAFCFHILYYTKNGVECKEKTICANTKNGVV
jgi:hypothetical protein